MFLKIIQQELWNKLFLFMLEIKHKDIKDRKKTGINIQNRNKHRYYVNYSD